MCNLSKKGIKCFFPLFFIVYPGKLLQYSVIMMFGSTVFNTSDGLQKYNFTILIKNEPRNIEIFLFVKSPTGFFEKQGPSQH